MILKLFGNEFNLFKNMNVIKWEQIGDDDYKAMIGDYMLRAEKMSKKNWWWCVYFKEDNVDDSNSSRPGKNKSDAFMLAYEAYLIHSKNK